MPVKCFPHGDPGARFRPGSTQPGGNALIRSVAFLMPNCLSAVRVLLPALLDSVTEPFTIDCDVSPACVLPAPIASAGKGCWSDSDAGCSGLPSFPGASPVLDCLRSRHA